MRCDSCTKAMEHYKKIAPYNHNVAPTYNQLYAETLEQGREITRLMAKLDQYREELKDLHREIKRLGG